MLQAVLFSPYGAFAALFVITMTIAMIRKAQGKEINPTILFAILFGGGVLCIASLFIFYR